MGEARVVEVVRKPQPAEKVVVEYGGPVDDCHTLTMRRADVYDGDGVVIDVVNAGGGPTTWRGLRAGVATLKALRTAIDAFLGDGE